MNGRPHPIPELTSIIPLLLLAFLGVFAGIRYSEDEGRKRLLKLYYAFQIPWVSSDFFMYQFFVGTFAANGWLGGRSYWTVGLGARWQLSFFNNVSFGVGINTAALLMLLMSCLPNPWRATAPALPPVHENLG